MLSQSLRRPHFRATVAFTMPELLVVIGVIALLIIVLLPALAGALRTGDMATSMNRMRQIATFMQLYSSENREYIVPSQFDYADAAATFPVKVRSHDELGTLRYKGTWTDILWTYHDLGKSQVLVGAAFDDGEYRYDSPGKAVYDEVPDYDESPFRSAAPNSRNFPAGFYPGTPLAEGALPFGPGAQELGMPGFFAANNFFNAAPDAPIYNPWDPPASAQGRWYTTGQIKVPDRSMYLVDSLAGETIDPVVDGATADPYNNSDELEPKKIEVDFRYNGACLMLYLDGHMDPESAWRNLLDLEGCVNAAGDIQKGRGVRIRDLTNRSLPQCP